MGMLSEGKPSNVKPYRHPHYQERFQGIQEDRYQHYQGRRGNTHQYSWNKGITKPLFNRILSKTNNYYKFEKLQQKYMESKKRKLCNYQPSRIKIKKN